MRIKNIFVCMMCTSFLFLISSCGGGGGSSSSTSNTDDDTSDEVVTTSLIPDHITASLMFDADGDGDLDLVIGGNLTSSSTSDVLLINDGSANFTKSTTDLPSRYLGENGATVSYTAGDFNKDGNIDLLAIVVDAQDESFYADSELQLFTGNGDGTFNDATSNITDHDLENWPSWTRVADLNGDGYPDFVLAISGCSSETGTTDDGDCYGGRIYLNDGAGNFAPATVTTYDSYHTYTNYDKIVWPGGGEKTYASSLRVALDVLLGDMDNDGDIDIVAPNGYASGAIVTLLNESTADELKFKIVYSIDETLGDTYQQTQVKEGALIDINHDGYLDLVASQAVSGSDDDSDLVPLYAFLNNGTGAFDSDNTTEVFGTDVPGVEHARQWLIDDFNNDGYDDIFIADHGFDASPYPGHTNLLLLGDANGKLTDYSSSYLGTDSTYTHGATSGDVNADGYSDLFLNNWSDVADGGDHLLLNNAGEGFTAQDVTE